MVLVLLSLPIFLILAALVIDVARSTAAQADLQADADALALTAAYELDGAPDAIARAEAAMLALNNGVQFLDLRSDAGTRALSYGADVLAVFLTAIPPHDDQPINADWIQGHAAAQGYQARYVMVTARPLGGLQPLFPIVFGHDGGLPVQAQAVAMSYATACNLTPLFICNPAEATGQPLEALYAAGGLHGRLLRLQPLSGQQRPGNFGLMPVLNAPGTSVSDQKELASIIAGKPSQTCFGPGPVKTLPEAINIADGQDTIFDLYQSRFGNAQSEFPPDINVRKGFVPNDPNKPDYCKMSSIDPAKGYALGFPENAVMAVIGGGAAQARLGAGDWDIDRYWQVNFGAALTSAQKTAISSFPVLDSKGQVLPSRYDSYRHEIAQGLIGTLSVGGPGSTGKNRESGLPNCALSKGVQPVANKRVFFAAVIDCLAHPDPGAAATRPIRSYASLFATAPMAFDPKKDAMMDVEVIDLSGKAAGARREAVLVR